MPQDIPIKEFRERLAEIADRVEEGESFRVIRRSKPVFIVMKIGDIDPDEHWETIMDFTEGGKVEGVPAEKILKILRKIDR